VSTFKKNGATTLAVTTFSIMTLSTPSENVLLSIMKLDADCCYAMCCRVGFEIQTNMLSVVTLDVVRLSVMAPFATFSKVLLTSKNLLFLFLDKVIQDKLQGPVL
jgi:hypothetical protein